MGRKSKSCAELRDHTVRLVVEQRSSHDSEWEAICSMAGAVVSELFIKEVSEPILALPLRSTLAGTGGPWHGHPACMTSLGGGLDCWREQHP